MDSITCNRCRLSITKEELRENSQSGRKSPWRLVSYGDDFLYEPDDRRRSKHLCGACSAEIEKFMNGEAVPAAKQWSLCRMTITPTGTTSIGGSTRSL